jgi:hypothetical protein
MNMKRVRDQLFISPVWQSPVEPVVMSEESHEFGIEDDDAAETEAYAISNLSPERA